MLTKSPISPLPFSTLDRSKIISYQLMRQSLRLLQRRHSVDDAVVLVDGVPVVAVPFRIFIRMIFPHNKEGIRDGAVRVFVHDFKEPFDVGVRVTLCP